MGYVATTGVIRYWKPYQPFVIHRHHHVWFYEYNSRLSIEDEHTPVSLLVQQYPESGVHNSDSLNFITFELDLTSNSFRDKTILHMKVSYLPM